MRSPSAHKLIRTRLTRPRGHDSANPRAIGKISLARHRGTVAIIMGSVPFHANPRDLKSEWMMSVLSKYCGPALVALMVAALSVVSCTPTDTIRPIDPGDEDYPRAPVTLPSESFYFREWSYVGSGTKAREVQAYLHTTMEVTPRHRAIIAGANGAEYHGVVNRWHHDDGRVAYVPAAMYVRGEQVARSGSLDTGLVGSATTSNAGGLSATNHASLIAAQGDVDPLRAWVVVKDGVAEWTPWKQNVPGIVFAIANMPFGPLVTALMDEAGGPRKSVAGGPPWLHGGGAMRVLHTNPPGAITLAHGLDKPGWSISIRHQRIGDSNATAVFVEAQYGDGDDATFWLSRISLAPLSRGMVPRTRGSAFLPDGGALFQQDGVTRPRAMPRTRADRVALARILRTAALASEPIYSRESDGGFTIRWVSHPGQIPPPEKRVQNFATTERLKQKVERRWAREIESLTGTSRDELIALTEGIGSDLVGAASHHLRTMWLPHDADVHLIAHELMHVIRPHRYPNLDHAGLDTTLAAYLHDEGATEAAARELLGWPRIDDIHIVPVSTRSLGSMLLDLAYGYAPAVPGIHSHSMHELEYGVRLKLERPDGVPLVADDRRKGTVQVPIESSAASVLHSSQGNTPGNATDAFRLPTPHQSIGIVPLLAALMASEGKHWGLSSVIDAYRGDTPVYWFEGENHLGLDLGNLHPEGSTPKSSPPFLSHNEIMRIYAFAPPAPKQAAAPNTALPSTTLTIDQIADILRTKRGLTVLHGKTDDGTPVIGIRLKWMD